MHTQSTSVRIARAIIFALFMVGLGCNVSWWGQALFDPYMAGALTVGIMIIVSQFGSCYVDRK